MDIREEIFKNQDIKYRDFQARLIPTIEKEKIFGVRIPILREIAKKAVKENAKPSTDYYEEVMIKGFMVGYKKCDIDEHIADLKEFVPMIDNWAVCDCCVSTMKFTKNNLERMYDFICTFKGKSEYEERFVITMLMNYYLVDEYVDRVLEYYVSIDTDKYYVNMATAWALSIAFVKYRDKVKPLICSGVLNGDIHNMTISKISDSFRVEKEDKMYLKNFRRK